MIDKRIRFRRVIRIKLDSSDSNKLKDHLIPLSHKKSVLNRWVFQALANQMTLDLKASNFFDSGSLLFDYRANVSNENNQAIGELDSLETYSIYLDFTGSNEFDLTFRSFLVQLYRDVDQFNRWAKFALINQMNMELSFRAINKDGGMKFEFARTLSSASMEDRVNVKIEKNILLDPTISQGVNVIIEKKVPVEDRLEPVDLEITPVEEMNDTFELDSCLAGMIALDED
jgi:hypothetical protein